MAGNAGVRKDVGKLAAVFQEIGPRGDRSSVPVLAEKPAVPLAYPVIRARIYGLANIRSAASVDALLKLSTLGGQTKDDPAVFAEDVRTALAVLTGVDDSGGARRARPSRSRASVRWWSRCWRYAGRRSGVKATADRATASWGRSR